MAFVESLAKPVEGHEAHLNYFWDGVGDGGRRWVMVGDGRFSTTLDSVFRMLK